MNDPSIPAWRRYVNSLIAREISSFSRYYDALFQIFPRLEDQGILLEAVDAPLKKTTTNPADLAQALKALPEPARVVVLLNGSLNLDFDIEQTLQSLHPHLHRGCRLALVLYNPYLRAVYQLANRLGIRQGEVPTTFITETDVANLCKLTGFEVVRRRLIGYCPWRLGGLGSFVNRVLPLIPLARWLALVDLLVLRPTIATPSPPSISIVIPARNERGNIENALKRLPDTLQGGKIEVVFVEGHSNDGTWEEIQRLIPLYRQRFSIQAHQQTGKGKSDAVRLGFSKASHDLLTILDADLTMPPELLGRFYDAWRKGLGDFVNGNRLTYPMEGQAMRPLNLLGNIFFAKALSHVLGAQLGDTLCGTKLMSRRDYERMVAWRHDFGDFDPFGDFELLFPASILCLGIVNIPIRYRDRTYGSTNISRFRHGLMLLKMTWIGFFKVTLGWK